MLAAGAARVGTSSGVEIIEELEEAMASSPGAL
jgi:deoxyribose-phosphate aldolase